jgi:hypothetical protein
VFRGSWFRKRYKYTLHLTRTWNYCPSNCYEWSSCRTYRTKQTRYLSFNDFLFCSLWTVFFCSEDFINSSQYQSKTVDRIHWAWTEFLFLFLLLLCVCVGVSLVPDAIVVELFLDRLLQPQYQNGVVIDGFPRTTIQVNFTSLKQNNCQFKMLMNEFVWNVNVFGCLFSGGSCETLTRKNDWAQKGIFKYSLGSIFSTSLFLCDSSFCWRRNSKFKFFNLIFFVLYCCMILYVLFEWMKTNKNFMFRFNLWNLTEC